MRELIRSNDLVHVSWLRALLADSGIETRVLDNHAATLEGSAAAIVRRLVVDNDEYSHARRVLEEAGELGRDSGDS